MFNSLRGVLPAYRYVVQCWGCLFLACGQVGFAAFPLRMTEQL
jgi:hypothetical protein